MEFTACGAANPGCRRLSAGVYRCDDLRIGAKGPPERRLRAGLPAPQNRQDFGRTALWLGLNSLFFSASQRLSGEIVLRPSFISSLFSAPQRLRVEMTFRYRVISC